MEPERSPKQERVQNTPFKRVMTSLTVIVGTLTLVFVLFSIFGVFSSATEKEISSVNDSTQHTTTPPLGTVPTGNTSLAATTTQNETGTTTGTPRGSIVTEDLPPEEPAPDESNVVVELPPVVIPQAKDPSPSTLNYQYGISVAETLAIVSPTELATTLDDIVSLGVGWIRIDLAWNSIQPHNPDTFYWDHADRIITAAKERGLKVLPILTYTPRWARSSACDWDSKCEPRDPEEFAVFVRAAVERYAPLGVDAWEIWNEPNLRIFWKSGASPSRYTALLKAAYREIHDVDPDAVVITGGLAPVATGGGSITAREFVEAMYANGAHGYFDALGFHPYSFPLSPTYHKKSSAWSQMADTEWSLRSIMDEYGDSGKKIWLTEYGAPTGGPGSIADNNEHSVWSIPDHVTEDYQDQILREAITETRSHDWVGPLFWYSYQDLGISQSTKENHFGLLRYDGSHKPAYFSLRTLLTGE